MNFVLEEEMFRIFVGGSSSTQNQIDFEVKK